MPERARCDDNRLICIHYESVRRCGADSVTRRSCPRALARENAKLKRLIVAVDDWSHGCYGISINVIAKEVDKIRAKEGKGCKHDETN